ncbi:MAG: sigma-70 family RNA polymerase sigma factor [Lachnospiraceae bacterium]|nr:sigma-70 family RNA polymerase sigma factor [Lachnospiraceae bacterium]
MKIDEHNFTKELQQQNQNALMYVIDEYGGLIKSVISKTMIHMTEYQEECMNDVLLAVWENIDSFHPEKNSFKNWIAAIAKYKSIDYLRKYKKQFTEVSLEETEYDKSVSPDIFENEISEQTEELLSGLSPKDRELFMRLYVNEESLDSVSQSVNMSKAVIYNRLSRAKKKLRKRGRAS